MPQQPAPPTYVTRPGVTRQRRVYPPPVFAVVGGSNPTPLTAAQTEIDLTMAGAGKVTLITPRPLFG